MKLGPTKREDRANAVKYRAVGRSLLNTARDLATLDDPKYGNAVAILAIHAAIAYSDALSTGYRGIKSVDGDHTRVADTLQNALGNRADAAQIARLRGILDAKSHASYSGQYYTLSDGQSVLADTEKFVAWAEDLYQNRPAI